MYEYTNILIILGLACFALLSILRRDYALYLIVLLLPSYQIRFQVFGIPATFLEGAILILAARSLFPLRSWERSRGTPNRSSDLGSTERIKVKGDKITNLFILLLLLAALISVFTAPNLFKAAGIFKAYFFEAILFYFLTLLIMDTPEKLKGLFKTLAILVLYLSGFGIYQFITLYGLPYNWWAVEVESRRIISALNHPNALALLIGPILTMLIVLATPALSPFLPRGGKEKVLRWSAIILGLVTLYLSFSRAAWLALVITITFFALLSWRVTRSSSSPGEGKRPEGQERSKFWKIIIAPIIILLITLIIPFSRNKILDLVRGQDLSQQNRYVLWSAASDILKKSPLTGTGLTGFHEAYKNYPLGPDRVVQNYPHNFFLNFWVETGLLGLISIIGLLILFYKKVWIQLKSGNPYALAASAGMTMIILHGLVDVSYFKNDLSILFWLICALPNLKLD